MRSEVINIKTDSSTKKKARKIADDMGFSLSTLLNAYLKQFVKNKIVYFTSEPQVAEEPSEWLIKELEAAERDRKAGYVSPAFENVEDSIAWLNDPNRRYQNGKTDQDAD